jgi:hypothetical protein
VPEFTTTSSQEAVGLVGLTSGETLPLTPRRSESAEVISLYHVPVAPSVARESGVIFETEMPSLEELLRRNQVAYTILSRVPTRDRVAQTERRVWTFLAVLALTWGLIAGASFWIEGFPLTPGAAIFGGLAIIGLVVTVRFYSRQRLAPNEGL